ncbi:MAG: tetratricopeptide repeat protein [Burkholderiaceae bacterium]|nr:tetratricopeptide repeat protein [Burkholderiaceae bacterium]
MAYDLEEQEQIDTIKAWWGKYGNLISWVLIVVLGAYAGWSIWNTMQQKNVSKAGLLFEQMQQAASDKDNAKVQRAASDIQEQYGKTVYGEMSGLTAAKVAYDANDLKEAKAQLQAVIANGEDDEYKTIAKVRLAGILLDEKSYDEGLKLLAGEFPAQFEAMVADRKGDLLVAQNKIAEARVAYQTALDKTDQKNPGRQLIQAKLDAIGGATAKAAA